MCIRDRAGIDVEPALATAGVLNHLRNQVIVINFDGIAVADHRVRFLSDTNRIWASSARSLPNIGIGGAFGKGTGIRAIALHDGQKLTIRFHSGPGPSALCRIPHFYAKNVPNTVCGDEWPVAGALQAGVRPKRKWPGTSPGHS